MLERFCIDLNFSSVDYTLESGDSGAAPRNKKLLVALNSACSRCLIRMHSNEESSVRDRSAFLEPIWKREQYWLLIDTGCVGCLCRCTVDGQRDL